MVTSGSVGKGQRREALDQPEPESLKAFLDTSGLSCHLVSRAQKLSWGPCFPTGRERETGHTTVRAVFGPNTVASPILSRSP